MKKRTVFTVIFVLLVIAAIACGFYALRQKEAREKKEQEPPKSAYTLCDAAYLQAAQSIEQKLYPSDIDGVFYTLDPVQYYRVVGGKLETLAPAGSVRVSPQIGTATMSFKIPFVTVGKSVFGVGVWHSDGGVYNSAFAVLKKMPKALGNAAYLLLVDTHPSDAAATERLYSEIFSCSKTGEIGGYVFDQRNRTVEASGKLRTDWDTLKLSMLADDEVLHLSAKKYHQDSANQQYDLLKTTAQKTVTLAKAVSAQWVQREKSTYSFIQTDKTPAVYSLTGGKLTQTVKPAGSLEAWRFTEHFALDTDSLNLLKLDGGEAPDKALDFKAVYAVGEGSGKLVIIGKEENKDGEDYKVQKISVYDLRDNSVQTLYANDIMDENSPLAVCSEGILTQKGGKSVFISYEDIATILHNMV